MVAAKLFERRELLQFEKFLALGSVYGEIQIILSVLAQRLALKVPRLFTWRMIDKLVGHVSFYFGLVLGEGNVLHAHAFWT